MQQQWIPTHWKRFVWKLSYFLFSLCVLRVFCFCFWYIEIKKKMCFFWVSVLYLCLLLSQRKESSQDEKESSFDERYDYILKIENEINELKKENKELQNQSEILNFEILFKMKSLKETQNKVEKVK